MAEALNRECGMHGSARRIGSSLEFGHVLRDASLLQQVVPWALVTSDSAAELCHKEPFLQRFGESPTRGLTPFPGQAWIFLLHSSDIAWDLNRDPLSRQRGGKVRPERLAIAIELDQRL